MIWKQRAMVYDRKQRLREVAGTRPYLDALLAIRGDFADITDQEADLAVAVALGELTLEDAKKLYTP